jgi:hypothetical protein
MHCLALYRIRQGKCKEVFARVVDGWISVAYHC